MDHAARLRRWPLIAVLLLVLLVGAGLRLYRLPELPLGLHYDEAANGILAGEIASGDRLPIFIRAYTGKEVLFFYWASLWMRLAGRSVLALRLGAASAGLLTVAAAVWATRELLHGRRDAAWAAALTGGFLATSFWHLVLSRYAFRAVTQPLLQALAVGALWRGLRLAGTPPKGQSRRRSSGWAWLGLSGLFFGLTAYTYLAARAFPIPIAAGLATLLIVDRERRKARLRQLAFFVAVAAVTLAPLAHFWLSNPGTFWNRTQQVAAANWGEVWQGIRACLAMFFVRGDPYIRFNIPHRPLFGPAAATLFCAGMVTVIWWCVRRILSRGAPAREEASAGPHLRLAGYVFLLTVLPVMLLPSALAVGDVTPSNLRSAGLLPFAYVFPALGILTVAAIVRRWLPGIVIPCLWVTLATAALGSAAAVAYFRDWAPSSALYYASDGDLVDVAVFLNQSEDVSGAPVYVASEHYRHPTLAFLAHDYEDIRWVTGGRTVVFPQQGGARLIVPRSAAGDLPWIESVLNGDSLLVRAGQGPDGSLAYRAYRLPSSERPGPSLRRAANFAQTVELVGYDVIGEPTSGEQVDVAVWWRVLSVPEHGDLSPVARLVDPWGAVWAESSPFHYPGEQWAVGDVIVDHLSIPAGLGLPPGDYAVRLTMYSAQAGSALPVLDAEGRYAGTWVELPIALAPGASVLDIDADLDHLADKLGVRGRLEARIGDLTLAGANLETTSLRPGDRLRATLFWGAHSSDLPDYVVELVLGDVTLYSGSPVHGAYPFEEWTAGQVVVDRYDPRVPREAPSGDYALTLHLYDPEVGPNDAQEIGLGVIAVHAVDRSFDVPPYSEARPATFGGEVELLGYDLSADSGAPGATIAVTLHWRAQAEMNEDYTIFVHLVGPGGLIAGQHDGQPVGGTHPTSLWMAGEVVADVHELTVRSDAVAGEYWIEAGVYVADTGVRLVDAITGADAVRLQPASVATP